MNTSGYQVGGSAGTAQAAESAPAKAGYWSLSKCKKAYLDYLGNKREEIDEAKNARRYYHGSQWTEEQIKTLKKRKQPVVTFNRIGRKIDGVVGLIERLRQDPKAYPRTPVHEEGAELATAAIRYVLDEQEWNAKSPEVARDGAIEGIGGVELELTDGDNGDKEISFDIVEPDSFFYDPRSYRADFTDARYMGLGKWVDLDVAQEMFPDKAEELKASYDGIGSELSTNPDRENKWFSQTGERQIIRLVDIWYQHKGRWCWAIFTGSMILMEGESYLKDEKGKGACKYIMYSGCVDHDGDRYGFVRNMKSAQDEYNARRSRALFTANSRRLIMSEGAVKDVELARREWARPDGVVVVQGQNVNEAAKTDDHNFDFTGQLKLMENAIAELENYGPNQALVGDMSNQSGRAIQLLQQAGMAELGPYILQYKGWKIRLYRAIWNACRTHWQAERWIRVTDNQDLPQLIQINATGVDPNTGMPAIINSLGALDVDIIIDEGADTVNMQGDAYDTLTALAGKGANVPPQVLLELSPLPASTKKRLTDMMKEQAQKPDPEVEKAQAMLQLEQQKAAGQQQLKQQEIEADAMAEERKSVRETDLAQRKAASDAQLAREKAEAEIRLKREVAAAELELERQRAQAQAEVEGFKVQSAMERDKQKHDLAQHIKRQESVMGDNERLEGDIESNGEKIAEVIAEMFKGMSEMGKSIESMAEKISAPKRIVRDAKGNIIGAEPVEAL